MAFTYRFLDTSGNIIYIGKTSQSLDARMAQHFGGRGHLSQEAYNSVARIEYKKWKTESDALIMETFYITQFNPKYNKLQKSRDIPTIVMDDEKEWKLYRQLKPVSKSKVRDTGYWRVIAVLYLIAMWAYYLFFIK